MRILAHPRALSSAKFHLHCNILIALFSKRKYNFSDEHAVDEKF